MENIQRVEDKMKILNLYAGIGGNRKLWGDSHEITAVENNPEIAAIYQSFFPNDKVVVADAHQYLLEHFKEFDFIWSSPPCPTHSRVNTFLKGSDIYRFPDMKLYEEIIFLKSFFNGKWVIENVISYYEPLIKPYSCNNHYYWSNFYIDNKSNEVRNIITGSDRQFKNTQDKVVFLEKEFGFDFSNKDLTLTLKEKILNNCVQPKIGLYVFDCAFRTKQQVLGEVIEVQ